MHFTVKDFLSLDLIKDAKVLTAKDQINKKIIESISVIELPVENFVHKDELVLTTCIGCDDDTTFFNFVKDVYNSGASALVISVGRYVNSIPQKIINLANELGFPIILIPWKIRFASIIETVLLEINNLRQAHIKRFEDLQKKLLTLFLNGSTLSEAANLIYEELGNQAVIVNSLGTIRGISKYSKELLKIIEPPLNILKSGNNLELLDTFDTKDIYRVYKIGSKNLTYGFLYLKLKEENDTDYIKNNKMLVVRYIVSAISLWFDREQTIFETEMHHKDEFVWSLIQSNENELEDLLSQSKTLGYDLSLRYICIVGMLTDFEKSYYNQRSTFTSYEEWMFNCIKTVKSQIIRAGQSMEREIMLTYQDERLIIFLEINEDKVEKLANNFIDIVESQIKPIYPDLIISWGIGAYKTEFPHLKKGYLDAKLSLDIGRNEEEPGFRYIYYNTSIYRLLSILLNEKETHQIITNIIGKLIEYDENSGLDLINTFKAYIKNKGNVSQTARSLHLHRQSLLYRLKRIEDITEMSLDNSDDIFLLEICIRLWDKKNALVM